MRVKNTLWMLLVLALPVLIGCQVLKNRKPQAAGSTAYCTNCLLEDIDKDLAELQNAVQKSNPQRVKHQSVKTPILVRSAVVLDANGKPVCRVDFSQHPDLVPDFAKPSPDKTVYQARKSQRGLASVAEKNDLPPCTGEYLSQLKKVVKNNVVINSDKSHMHKTGGAMRIAGTAICALGAAVGWVNTLRSKYHPTIQQAQGVVISAGSAALLRKYSKKVKKFEQQLQNKWMTGSRSEILHLSEKWKWARIMKVTSLAILIGSVCDLGAEAASTVIYETEAN